jgi:hypothetical protein
LLRSVTPALLGTRFTWVLIHVAAARAPAGLCAEVGAATKRAAIVIRKLLDQVGVRSNL